jgi:beta-glucanase (GH16 family)
VAVGTTAATPVGDPGTWHLVFDDEFNTPLLDTLDWSTGWFGSGITGPVNGPMENDCYDPAQVVQANNELDLNLVARTESCAGTTKSYATGFVTTDGLFSYSYGFVEAKMWLPGSGSVADWPSFWQDGQSWPADGELDVLEGLGGQACAHWHGPTGNGAGFGPNGGTGCPPGTFTGGWHTFGADWEPGKVTWYYDGVDIGCIETSGSDCGPSNSTITGAPQYLVLGLALNASSPAVFPATQRVAYVRVWQH